MDVINFLLPNIDLALPYLIAGFLSGVLSALFMYLSLVRDDPPGIVQTVLQLLLVLLPVLLFADAYNTFFRELYATLGEASALALLIIALIFVPFYLGDLLANRLEDNLKRRALNSFDQTMKEMGL